MKIYLIGTGMHHSLTNEAQKAITESELLIGAKRMIEPFLNSGKRILISYHAEEIAEFLKSSGVQTASVVYSGDTGFFSGAEKLIPLLADEELKIISGISCVNYFCAKIRKSWEKMKFITLHGVENAIAIHVHQNRYCFFLLGGSVSAGEVCQRLCRYHLAETRIWIGENFGYASERILSGTAKDFVNHEETKLCVLIAENPEYCPYLPCGIADAEFIRSKIPMTKREIRCLCVSGMQIRNTDICWDIGCGTGSVSIEMALQSREVLALDKNPEAVNLTRQNAEKFCCDNIQVIQGNASEIPEELLTPDKVFIGGASGQMMNIFEVISRKNPDALITATAISLETLQEVIQAFEAYHQECEVKQIAVTETKKIGSHTMLNAQNPIFIIRGKLS